MVVGLDNIHVLYVHSIPILGLCFPTVPWLGSSILQGLATLKRNLNRTSEQKVKLLPFGSGWDDYSTSWVYLWR